MCGKKGVRAEEMATEAGGTHPTGMHFYDCFIFGEEVELQNESPCGSVT